VTLAWTVEVSAAGSSTVREAEVDRVRLEYVEQGSGAPVVLVHGAASDQRVWEAVREALAARHRVITH
jgi:pimeloyl-ACP methyl ester carboxylesterase